MIIKGVHMTNAFKPKFNFGTQKNSILLKDLFLFRKDFFKKESIDLETLYISIEETNFGDEPSGAEVFLSTKKYKNKYPNKKDNFIEDKYKKCIIKIDNNEMIPELLSHISVQSNQYCQVMIKVTAIDEASWLGDNDEYTQYFQFEVGGIKPSEKSLIQKNKQIAEEKKQLKSQLENLSSKYQSLSEEKKKLEDRNTSLSDEQRKIKQQLNQQYYEAKDEKAKLETRLLNEYQEKSQKFLSQLLVQKNLLDKTDPSAGKEYSEDLDKSADSKINKFQQTPIQTTCQVIYKEKAIFYAKQLEKHQEFLKKTILEWQVEQIDSVISRFKDYKQYRNNVHSAINAAHKLTQTMRKNLMRDIDETFPKASKGEKSFELPSNIVQKLRSTRHLRLLKVSTQFFGSRDNRDYLNVTNKTNSDQFNKHYIASNEVDQNQKIKYQEGKFIFPKDTKYVYFYDASFTSTPDIPHDQLGYGIMDFIPNDEFYSDKDLSACWTYKNERLLPHQIYVVSLEDFQKNVKIQDGQGIVLDRKNVGCIDKLGVIAHLNYDPNESYYKHKTSPIFTFTHTTPGK